MDVFPNGNILIGNGGTSSVKLFDSNGNYLEDFIASGAGNLLTPNAVVIRQNVSVSISEGDNTSGINQFILKQNYPNPFNPSTQIEFSIPGPLHVKLEIFNMLGERMDVLVSQSMSAGEHSIEWNAEEVPSGIYMYRLTAGDRIESRKMVLLR